MESLRRLNSVKHSFLAVMEQFLHTVDLMDDTVLIPMKLIDFPVKELMPPNFTATDSFLQNNMNMRAFFFLVKAMRSKLSLGYGQSSEVEESFVPLEREIQESCHRLNQLALVAKYIQISTHNLVPNDELLSFQEFQNRLPFHSENCLHGALKKFIVEVESLEKSVLFPCLLKDYRVSEQMPQFDEEIQTLYEAFVFLKSLRTELLLGSRNFKLPDAKLQQKLSKLFHFFVQYTVIARNLAARYEEEVRCY